jgi:hypothetical protein
MNGLKVMKERENATFHLLGLRFFRWENSMARCFENWIRTDFFIFENTLKFAAAI